VLRLLRSDEQGQVVPVLALLVVAALTGGFLLFEVGRATALRADAQTAADAAALAAAEALHGQFRAAIRNGDYELLAPPDPFEPARLPDVDRVLQPRHELARTVAADYARRNGAELIDYRPEGLGARVRVRTTRALDGSGAQQVGAAGTRAEASARARFSPRWLPGAGQLIIPAPPPRPTPPPQPEEPPDPDDDDPSPPPPPPPPPLPVPNPVGDPDRVARLTVHLLPQ
jgi:hypothetical protein